MLLVRKAQVQCLRCALKYAYVNRNQQFSIILPKRSIVQSVVLLTPYEVPTMSTFPNNTTSTAASDSVADKHGSKAIHRKYRFSHGLRSICRFSEAMNPLRNLTPTLRFAIMALVPVVGPVEYTTPVSQSLLPSPLTPHRYALLRQQNVSDVYVTKCARASERVRAPRRRTATSQPSPLLPWMPQQAVPRTLCN